MTKKFHKPIRMCASCRERSLQHTLIRLQCKDGELLDFSGQGRSFYICKNCLLEQKKVLKAIMRQCKSSKIDKFTSKLKEIITDE